MFKLFFDVKPEPKARPRLGRHGTYTPSKTKMAEREMATLAKLQWGARPHLVSPLSVVITVSILKPASKKKSVLFPCVRPDIDNYAKLVCDALNGIVWKDDGQICELLVRKVYSNQQSIEIQIRELEETFLCLSLP